MLRGSQSSEVGGFFKLISNTWFHYYVRGGTIDNSANLRKMLKNKVFEKYLSEPRLKPYFRTCNNDVKRGLELYQLNARLSAAFLPLLSLVEVTVRNAFDEALSRFFATPDWSESFEKLLKTESENKVKELIVRYGIPPKGFNDSEPLLSTAKTLRSIKNKITRDKENIIRDKIKREIRKFKEYKELNDFQFLIRLEEEVAKELKDKKIEFKHREIISNSNFGFWTTLLKEDVYRVTKGVFIDEFPNRGVLGRKEIAEILDKIRKFRNRVAHNEPLCFIDEQFDLSETREAYELCRKILHFLNQDLEVFSEELYIIYDELKHVEQYIVQLPIIIGYDDK